MWITDPKTNKKSVTLTLLVLGFSLAAFKLLLSGMTIAGLSFSDFSGVDFGAVLGSIGGMYAWRKKTDATDKKDPDERTI